MKINSSLKTRSTASFFTFSSARFSVFAVAVLSMVSFSSGHADVWLNETFENYTVGEVINNIKSPLLITSVSNSTILYTTATNTNSGIMMRYQKSTTSNGQTVAFLLTSDTNTTRTNGYFSIKVNQNVNASIPVGNNLFVPRNNKFFSCFWVNLLYFSYFLINFT